MKRFGIALLYVVFFITLTVFFMRFTFDYMRYFDVGINNGMRAWDINWIRTPIAVIAQVIALFLGNKFIGNVRWRTVLHFALLFVVTCLVFAGFAITDVGSGIPRQGGFLRFLGYYFLNLEPGQMPNGTW